ncbi:MAG: hypothetical protein IPM25_01265 [Chloracidobacterium sp.]|nr:hypothetical protein [Chloracidobacterium sp.]
MGSILWVLLGLVGIWFLASAATEQGLLPSGHGFGRVSEVVIGLALVAYAAYRAKRHFTR